MYVCVFYVCMYVCMYNICKYVNMHLLDQKGLEEDLERERKRISEQRRHRNLDVQQPQDEILSRYISVYVCACMYLHIYVCR